MNISRQMIQQIHFLRAFPVRGKGYLRRVVILARLDIAATVVGQICCAFAAAISESGESVPLLRDISSTTFDHQMRVAANVVSENPHLYFEIQSLNEFGGESLRALRHATDRIIDLVERKDEHGFLELMLSGRDYVALRSSRQKTAG